MQKEIARRSFSLFKFIFGNPLATDQMHNEKIRKLKGLAIFASDALSSVAYATEEILLVLIIVGASSLTLSLPIALAITVLIVLVAISYRQIIMAYPNGGGSYLVSKENLGTLPSLIAGSSLMIDYILTVAVSVAAGVAAITSAIPILYHHKVALCLVVITLITITNLRGIRDTANVFVFPTYVFIVTIFGLIIYGFIYQWQHPPLPLAPMLNDIAKPLTLFILFKAFAAGCTALTGIEAISDGVATFKEPSSRNASVTLIWMAVILGFMFLGITYLANAFHVVPLHDETVLSQITRAIFGTSFFYYMVQGATATILLLAANTAYADFPRVASFLARDSFLPRQLAQVGDRLVFSNGIVILGAASAFLVSFFQGNVHFLIPLYAVGVFMSFTLSQTGMVKHWFSQRRIFKNWWRLAMINGFGASICLIVLLIIATVKFFAGAWLVLLCLPLFVLMFFSIHRHYDAVAVQISVKHFNPDRPLPPSITYVLAGNINLPTLRSLHYAKATYGNVTALHVAFSELEAREFEEQWKDFGMGVPLKVLFSPYRSLFSPVLEYIAEIKDQKDAPLVTVVIPEFIPAKRWHLFLHNQSAYRLNWELRKIPGVMVNHYRYRLRV